MFYMSWVGELTFIRFNSTPAQSDAQFCYGKLLVDLCKAASSYACSNLGSNKQHWVENFWESWAILTKSGKEKVNWRTPELSVHWPWWNLAAEHGRTWYSLYFSTSGCHPHLLVDHRSGTKPQNSTNPKPYSEYNRDLVELPVMSHRTVHVSPSSYISEDWEFVTAAAWEFITNILGITFVFYYGIKQNQDLIWSQIASILLWARGWLQKRPSKGDDMTVSIW